MGIFFPNVTERIKEVIDDFSNYYNLVLHPPGKRKGKKTTQNRKEKYRGGTKGNELTWDKVKNKA